MFPRGGIIMATRSLSPMGTWNIGNGGVNCQPIIISQLEVPQPTRRHSKTSGAYNRPHLEQIKLSFKPKNTRVRIPASNEVITNYLGGNEAVGDAVATIYQKGYSEVRFIDFVQLLNNANLTIAFNEGGFDLVR